MDDAWDEFLVLQHQIRESMLDAHWDPPANTRASIPRAHGTGYADAAVRGAFLDFHAALDGGRNNALNRCAFRLGQLVRDELVDPDWALEHLIEAGVAVGLREWEARGAARSGLGAGMRS